MERIIFWLKVRLGWIEWIAEPSYYQEGGKVLCVSCGDFGWQKRGDLDVHDMKHWK